MTTADELLEFWLNELTPEDWFREDETLDARIRERFADAWELARKGELNSWTCKPRSTLALIILLDQVPRNIFRGDPRSYATDAQALALAKKAIARGFPAKVAAPERQFFYLPLMHSEVPANQDRCVRCILSEPDLADNLAHAQAHRAIIRRFSRFPARNAALGRTSGEEELAFLAEGGYRAALSEVQAA